MPSLKDCIQIAKPRIVSMVLVTTTIGYLLGAGGKPEWLTLLLTLVGTAFAAGGSAVLNNYLEREFDSRMLRTQNRALPAGRIEPSFALAYGVLLVLAGVSLAVWQVNLVTGFLILLSAFLYVVVYTPLKRLTWLNTSIGAIPGALPPMHGWTAGSGEIELGAWVLFLILFAWQHPHFYSIAWMYREDYQRGGYRMLSSEDADGSRLFLHGLLFTAMLVAVSIVPTVIGMTGYVYLAGALGLGALMVRTGRLFQVEKTVAGARRVLRASIIYLPVLLLLIVVDGVL